MSSSRPPASTLNALRTMKGTPRRDTAPERHLRAELRRKGVRGYRIDLPGIPGRPDVVFTKWRLAVFVHGCFWHRCPHCELKLPVRNQGFWKEKFEQTIARDERNLRLLEATGWTVLVFWECELQRSVDRCVREVVRLIRRIRIASECHEEVLETARRMQTRRGRRS